MIYLVQMMIFHSYWHVKLPEGTFGHFTCGKSMKIHHWQILLVGKPMVFIIIYVNSPENRQIGNRHDTGCYGFNV